MNKKFQGTKKGTAGIRTQVKGFKVLYATATSQRQYINYKFIKKNFIQVLLKFIKFFLFIKF